MLDKLEEFKNKYSSTPQLTGVIEDKYVETIDGKPRIHSFSLKQNTLVPKIAFIRVPEGSFDVQPIEITKGHKVTVIAHRFTNMELEASLNGSESSYNCSLHAFANHTSNIFYDTSAEVENPISWDNI